MDIVSNTLAVLAIISKKPDGYKNVLELPRVGKSSPELLDTYLGMIIQSVLIVNDSIYNLDSKSLAQYATCLQWFHSHDIAYSRSFAPASYNYLHRLLKLQLPIEWINPTLGDYQLSLFGPYLYVDWAKREYISDFNDSRLRQKALAAWAVDYAPIREYNRFNEINEKLRRTHS